MIPNRPLLDKIRSFNRFFTSTIGLLNQNFLESPFSLTEGRVLYEINTIRNCSAKIIRANINIDEGYLSRIIEKFKRQGLVTKSLSLQDRRLHIITPTEKGRKEFLKLNDRSDQYITHLVENLSPNERLELVNSMDKIHQLLEKNRASEIPNQIQENDLYGKHD
jgi:DNA-binding MarR family transcriptional regulator